MDSSWLPLSVLIGPAVMLALSASVYLSRIADALDRIADELERDEDEAEEARPEDEEG